ncbi:MAG: hypothetical protein H0V60_09975 [Actinobacteria bacterium]|nr:hypothetical protein [Actinomycetota bacterium]
MAISVAALTMAVMPSASANHAVLVEGEQDYDGDGLIGQAEDNDNATDRIFGTITAALGAANGGAGQTGRVTIVTSGRFFESVTIAPTTGNVTLEAAPGVEANVEAVAVGDRVNDSPDLRTPRPCRRCPASS